jgi:aryl-alcohol dehydrogenase-like predicted oxidoreductase
MFTLDEKKYDESKLNDEGKIAYVKLQSISNERTQLALKNDELNVLQEHYSKVLKDNLPEEIKEEKKENGTGE